MLKNILAHFSSRPRLYGALVLGIGLYWFLPASLDVPTRLLVSWNVAIVAFLIMAGYVMATASDASMRKRAQATDGGRFTVLLMSIAAAVTSLVAIVVELYNVRNNAGESAAFYLALSVTTILTAWSFIHIIFTEHYAHEYYIDRTGAKSRAVYKGSGLTFPGEKKPDYIDFLYFTFTIGVANQTSDVVVEDRSMRVLVLIHSVISYFFNTIILALTINIAAGLLQG